MPASITNLFDKTFLICHVCKTEFSTLISLIEHYFCHKEHKIDEIKSMILQVVSKAEKVVSEISCCNENLREEKNLLNRKLESLEKELDNYRLKEANGVNNFVENVNCKEEVEISDDQFTFVDALENSVNKTSDSDIENVSNKSKINENGEGSSCDEASQDKDLREKSIEIQATNKTENKINVKKKKLNVKHETDNSQKKTLLEKEESEIEVSKDHKPYYCGICSKRFLDFTCRNNHVQKFHYFDNDLQCDICQEKLKSKTDFNKHIKCHFKVNPRKKVINKDSKPYYCGVCNKTFRDFHCRNNHVQKFHYFDKELECDLCQATLKTKIDYIKHIRCHFKHNTRRKVHCCQICKKTYTQISRLKQHMLLHSGNPYACLKCNEIFPRNKDLIFHKHIVHSKKEPINCELCDFTCVSRCHLITHMKVHTGEKNFLCFYCGQSFTTKMILEHHIQNKHTGGTKYQCDFCQAYFPHKPAIERHILQHTGYKPYICDICGKGCSEMGNLNQHLRSHTGEKPKKCNICGKGFLRNSFLSQHMEREHRR